MSALALLEENHLVASILIIPTGVLPPSSSLGKGIPFYSSILLCTKSDGCRAVLLLSPFSRESAFWGNRGCRDLEKVEAEILVF